MKRWRIYLCALITASILVQGCTISKRPYFTTDYYNKSESELKNPKVKVHMVNDTFYAGFSRLSITPDLKNLPDNRRNRKGLPMAGYGRLKTKYATGILDSLFVRAAAFKAGNDTIIILSADMLILPPNIIRSVISDLGAKGFRRHQLFMSAVHTHSGIGGWGYGILARLMAGKENKNIEDMLAETITEAVVTAAADLQPATLGTGSFHAPQFIRNRLTGDPEQVNDEFMYLVAEQAGGKRAIIGSFSAHATAIGSSNTLLSADYPGQWAGKIEKKYASVAIFCAGSMGSQAPLGDGSDAERARSIGEALADSVIKGISKTEMSKIIQLASMSLPLGLPDYHMRLSKNLNLTKELSSSLMEKPEDVYLQALRINNLIWFFTPGDFSGELALSVKRQLAARGFRSMVTGYNGSYTGYIIPGKYFWLDHYEPRTMSWFGPFFGEYVTDMLIQMSEAVIVD